MRKQQQQAREQNAPRLVRVRIVSPVSVTYLGTLEEGEYEVERDLAELLVARGFAKWMQEKEEEEVK